MMIIRRGGVAWTWAGVRRAVMGDGEGRREVAGINVIIINHPHHYRVIFLFVIDEAVGEGCHQRWGHQHICCPYQTLFDIIITVPVTIMVDVTTNKIIIANNIIIIIITI